MINIDISNSLAEKNFAEIGSKLAEISKKETPKFSSYKEDTAKLKKQLTKYRKYKNIIVIGSGGSNTSFAAFYGAMQAYRNKVKVFILKTMEPDAISDIKRKCSPKDTLMIAISKSGDTVGVIDDLFAFSEYKKLAVAGGGTLYEIAKKSNIDIIHHPDIGGRYSGLTSCAYTPAILVGIPVERITKGALSMYKKCSPAVDIKNNPALQISATLYLLEKKGYDQIFTSIYSSRLVKFLPLMVQLIHESSCKDGKGQTIYGDMGPEIQHHSNQRFFGGKKNAVGLFVTAKFDDEKSKIKVPEKLKDIKLKDSTLKELDNLRLSKALEFEFLGAHDDAINNKIPLIHIHVDKITPESVGEYLALWQYIAVYSSWLRDVNPFDQPQVEESKRISFQYLKSHKK